MWQLSTSPALDAALSTAGYVSNRWCPPTCQEPENDCALQKGTARIVLAHLPPSPETLTQSALDFTWL